MPSPAGPFVRLPKLPPEYSLLFVRSDGGRTRVFIRTDRRRIEMEFGNGDRRITVARGDLGVAWQMQSADSWIETPLDPRVWSVDADPSNFLTWKEVGTDQIDGELCTRYQGFMGEPTGTPVEDCFVLPSGVRRRTVTYCTDGSVGITINSLDVRLGPPPSEFFELPSNAKVTRIGGKKATRGDRSNRK